MVSHSRSPLARCCTARADQASLPPYSPLIVPHLDELDGTTYAELFASALDIIRKVYDKQGAQVVGFKEVWVDEFTPHFRRLNPGNKIIHLIRDPRSVVASNFASVSTYPLMFLIRQWRKIVTLAWYNADHSADVKLVRFEDLLSDPETVARQLCEFLKVNFHENMTDPSSYTDGAGQPWRQNTSYRKNAERDGERRFNRTALDKWKQVLTDEVLTLIDLFCSREMALLGYQPASDIEVISRRLDILDYEDDPTTRAEWIKPYATYNNIKEILAELQRLALIESQRELSEQSKRLLTLEPGMFEVLVVAFRSAMNIVIRADACWIGSGHVVRCTTLARVLNKVGTKVHFISRRMPGDFIDWQRNLGFTVHALERSEKPGAGEAGQLHYPWLGTSLGAELEQVVAVLEDIGRVDWLIVDHYALDRHGRAGCGPAPRVSWS